MECMIIHIEDPEYTTKLEKQGRIKHIVYLHNQHAKIGYFAILKSEVKELKEPNPFKMVSQNTKYHGINHTKVVEVFTMKLIYRNF